MIPSKDRRPHLRKSIFAATSIFLFETCGKQHGAPGNGKDTRFFLYQSHDNRIRQHHFCVPLHAAVETRVFISWSCLFWCKALLSPVIGGARKLQDLSLDPPRITEPSLFHRICLNRKHNSSYCFLKYIFLRNGLTKASRLQLPAPYGLCMWLSFTREERFYLILSPINALKLFWFTGFLSVVNSHIRQKLIPAIIVS